MQRLPARLVAVLSLILLAAFTLIEKGPSRALLWPWYLYAQFLALSPLLWLVLRSLLERRPLPRCGGMLDTGLLAFAAAMIAATLVSPDRRAGLALLPILLAPVAVAYAVIAWLEGDADGRRRRRLEHGGALFLAVASVVALAGWLTAVVRPQVAAGLPLVAALGGRNEWLLGHTVYSAGLGLLTTTWLAGLARERRGAARLACATGALVGLFTLLSSASRSGFIGLGLWLLWWLAHEVRGRRWSIRRTTLVAGALAAAALGLALLHPRTRLMVAEWRASGTLNMGDRQRLAMAEFGGIVLREHPLLGIGPGATPAVYAAERARLSGGVEAALQLHSAPVQWAADAGLAGLAAVGLIVFAVWRRRRLAPPSFAAGSLLAYAGLSLTDYQLDVPLFAFAVGVLLGLCVPSTPPEGPRPAATLKGPGTLAGALVLAALMAAYGATQLAPWRARAAFAEAIDALRAGDRDTFTRAFQEVHSLAPDEPFYYNLHACLVADVRAYPHWFPAVDFGPGRLAQADALLRESLRRDPRQELPHNHLGWRLLATRPDEAAAHFRAAYRLQPDKSGLYLGRAFAALRQQQAPLAARALAMELVNDPAFVSSPEWAGLESAAPGLASAARRAAAGELDQLALAAPAADPLRYARRARYTAALLRWLDGDVAALPVALTSAEPAPAEILAWLAGQPIALPTRPTAAWQLLALASARPAEAREVLARRYVGTPVEDFVLDDLIEASAAADRRELVLGTAASAGRHPPRIYRERAAYPLLQRNLDAPAPRDPYAPPLHRLVRDFLAPLFPEKGFLPGPVLRQAQSDLGL